MTHPINYIGNFNDGSLDVRVGNEYVLTVDLVELNQNDDKFQKDLLKELVEAVQGSFKLGRKYERDRIKNFLDKGEQ